MIAKELCGLFISVSLGYIICILAEKQKKILRTAGFAIGISIIALSLLAGITASNAKYGCPIMKVCKSMSCEKMMK